jgi:hypothetical protein
MVLLMKTLVLNHIIFEFALLKEIKLLWIMDPIYR